MKFHFRFPLSALLGLAITLSFSGCKPNNSSTTSQNAQPAQTTQSPQPSAAGQPATPTAGQPPASAPAANQPTTSEPAASQPASSNDQTAASAPQAPPPPAVIELPASARLRVHLDSDLGSNMSQPGDRFSATIADPVVINGQTVIPKGARAEGTVVDAKPLGRFKGGALLSIRLERVRTRWGSYPVATSSVDRAEQGKGKRSTGFIGGGAAFGAIIGGSQAAAKVRPSARWRAAVRAQPVPLSPATRRSFCPLRPC